MLEIDVELPLVQVACALSLLEGAYTGQPLLSGVTAAVGSKRLSHSRRSSSSKADLPSLV
jgi:hypothetical protein